MKRFHLHLVSDATGGTLDSVAKAVLSQFEDIKAIEHPWAFVRTPKQVERVLKEIKDKPGFVVCTLVNTDLGNQLMEGCRIIGTPCLPLLNPVIDSLAKFLGRQSRNLPGSQHMLDEDYFGRIEALHYTMAHDDGQAPENLYKADIILVGVSRTSKTPTCIYLANRGYKAANVPVVPGCPLPKELEALEQGPMVVGLTISPDRLVPVRRNRMMSLNEESTDYIDPEVVMEELATARRLFAEKEWPVVDVTRRSIEETAAAVINHLARREESK